MAKFVTNTDDTVSVRKERVKCWEVQGLTVIFKMLDGPDIVLATAPDEATLATWISALKTQLEED